MVTKVLLIVVVGLVGGALLYWLSGDGRVEPERLARERTAQPSNGQTFTAEQVGQHASKDDCWTIINDQVFDVTPFIEHHPGGDEILRACGRDGSSLFNNRQTEGGQTVGSGRPHSDNAVDILADLYVGDLK